MSEQQESNKNKPSFLRTQRFAKVLLDVTNQLAKSNNLDEALNTLVSLTAATVEAERGTIFLNDDYSGELYSRVAQGNLKREIRILNNAGIAGWVFTNQKGVLIEDAYEDERFDRNIDEQTGYRTRTVLCTPLVSAKGEIIGVAQFLNKSEGHFNQKDLETVSAMAQQAAVVLQNNIVIEQMAKSRKQELEFLNIVTSLSSELNLSKLLSLIISTITKMLDADRSTLFINDEKTNELYTEVGEGLGKTVIRFPNHLGIAGTVFTTRKNINIPHAYADLRFNPSFDKQTGFFTRSILCCPVFNKSGKVIGVTQVLNKKGGPFTDADEAKLEAFTSQISIGIENAKLFDDVQTIKNYNESMLQSMTNGVITTDTENKIVTCNIAGLRILDLDAAENILSKTMEEFFGQENQWILDTYTKIQEYTKHSDQEILMDQELDCRGEKKSVNVTLQPLLDNKEKKLGSLLMIEDISSEKRMKSTMSRYMDSGLADKLLEGGDDILGGTSSIATVLFSDIRSFTTLTEQLGAEGTVSLLNDYFSVMVDCIQDEGGMLDKFIGDAMMAIFGTPFPHDDDPDRALRAAIRMMTELTDFNARRAKKGQMEIFHGIGLNTDSVVSGNIGSPKRMDYTVIGDGVNLAARLESACKQYGAKVLISEYTFNGLKATYRTRHVDRVIVKGKTEPVNVFEVLDFMTKEDFPNMIEALGHFNDGMSYYQDAEWDNAIKKFNETLALNEKDVCSKVYIERCNYMKENPPKEEWNGVWTMTSK